MSIEPSAVERVAADLGFDIHPDELWRKLAEALENLGLAGDSSARRRFETGEWTAQEREAVVQAVTNGETYFFRHGQELLALQQRLRESAMHRDRAALHIWSAACSSGEEAYTLAILLEQMRSTQPQLQFNILATDINPFALQRARAAHYRSWSFREEAEQYRDQWFTKIKPGVWQPIALLRQSIEFAQHNLLHPLAHPMHGRLDCILCRNVLIYFHGEAVARVLELLAAALAEEGYLVVSPSEVPLLVQHGWHRLPSDYGFFFGKPCPFAVPVAPKPVSRKRPLAQPIVPKPVTPKAKVAVEPSMQPLIASEGDTAQEPVKDWTGHGWWQLEAEDCSGAARCFRSALFAEPERLDARLGLARALQGMGRATESRKQLQLLLRTLDSLEPSLCPPELDGMAVAQFRMQISTLLQAP